MTSGSDESQRALAYYKRRLDELAGECLRLDYEISGLRKEVTQKRQAFTLLSRLQRAIGPEKHVSNLFEMVLREVNSTLGMDKTVVLTPTDQESHYRPTQWTGFTEQGRSLELERRMNETTIVFPPEFSRGTGQLLVNRKTERSAIIQQLSDTFELPFFVCVPVLVEQKPVGLLLSGRIKEGGTVLPPLDQGDVETLQSIAGLISASIENMRIGVLTETDRLKTEFFANISHEFRTPIALTLGPLESLLAGRCGEIPSEAREQMLVMQRNQERLLGLITQILDLAKLEAGSMRLRAAPTPNLNTIVAKRVAQFRSAATHRGLEVRLVLDDAVDGADLYVDRERFDRLFVNLLSNALKFTNKGSIEVSTWRRDDAVWLQVADTGIGVKEDQLPHIFDRFRQADGSESRSYAGTGIGLALVQEIAHLHGGEVSVLSQYGKGSSFRIKLPLGRQHLPEESIATPEDEVEQQEILSAFAGVPDQIARTDDANRETEEHFSADRPSVLCAEDNPELRRHIKDLLRSDYNVFVAADGHEAIRLARAYKPDLIVTDQMMPNVSGRELLRMVRADETLRTTPVVFLTARAGTEARIEGLEGGADDYLTKPFHAGELKARVANLIRARMLEKQLVDVNRRLLARVEEQLAELVRTGQLKQFLPQNLVESVLEGRGLSNAFERRKLTILFAELAGFAETAGMLEPEELALVASDFTREMVAVAVRNRGSVAHVSAHSLMVLFGAEDDGSDSAAHAIAAVRTAIGMREAMSALAAGWRKRGISPALAFRAGINSGYCTVGVFGSEYLRCFTAVGASVEIAANLRNAASPGQILSGSSTCGQVEGLVRARSVGPLTVDGAIRPIDAFEIEGVTESSPDDPDGLVRAGAGRIGPLVPGTRLAHYQILKKIGAGGMGEVYRAMDTRLDRAVALKVLSSHIASDPDHQNRLRREARAVAALRHPNIVNVYSVEEASGHQFITMEFVEGHRLLDLIPPTGLELGRLSHIGLQLIDAVTGAHAHGITHRDLKPANVMVDRDSRVKVLDFGLAKLTPLDTSSGVTMAQPDVHTAAGVVVGTIPYMAPEQIQGRAADHRSDIFSLGVILYEMATGRRPFQGVSSAEIMASILRDVPESISAIRPDLPEPLGRIVNRCLMKLPEERYTSTKALHRELEILR